MPTIDIQTASLESFIRDSNITGSTKKSELRDILDESTIFDAHTRAFLKSVINAMPIDPQEPLSNLSYYYENDFSSKLNIGQKKVAAFRAILELLDIKLITLDTDDDRYSLHQLFRAIQKRRQLGFNQASLLSTIAYHLIKTTEHSNYKAFYEAYKNNREELIIELNRFKDSWPTPIVTLLGSTIFRMTTEEKRTEAIEITDRINVPMGVVLIINYLFDTMAAKIEEA